MNSPNDPVSVVREALISARKFLGPMGNAAASLEYKNLGEAMNALASLAPQAEAQAVEPVMYQSRAVIRTGKPTLWGSWHECNAVHYRKIIAAKNELVEARALIVMAPPDTASSPEKPNG